jgi:LysM repeat protein
MFHTVFKRTISACLRAAPVIILAAVLAGLWFGISHAGLLAVQAAPPAQIPIYTPTPGPDGRIIYIVKPNDTLLGISLLTGVSIEQLRAQNNLTSDTIYEGQKLLLGMGGPPVQATPTAGPSPTPTPILPTPTPKPGQGTLCIILFNDLNGDSIRQSDEPSIPDGAISFGNRSGSVSKNEPTTAGLDHQCFKDLPEGDYTVSVAAPPGYNPTTETSFETNLKPGDETYINFGAQANSETAANQPTVPAQQGGRSPLLGLIGVFFLLAGVGVAVFALRTFRSH